MVRYYCDKCGKEVPKEKIRHCSLYVKEHKTGLGEIRLTYCQECFEEIIGADNVANAELSKKDTEIDILIQKKNNAYDEIAELKAEVERLQREGLVLNNTFFTDYEIDNLVKEMTE